MSILNKPYEISIWNDVWDSVQQKFVEKKICVIGSNQMESQSRAFDPSFSRNVNGVKKLSFKMYKSYIDSITGEKVDNPFVNELISERKVKLYLEDEDENDRWHDFVIKNITENSNTHLITCTLDDAFVQELSKNGFGVILNKDVFFEENGATVSNIGTINQLARRVLRETDWTIPSNSETFVQTIEEPLVYLSVNEAFPGTIYRLIDSNESSLKTSGVQESVATIPTGSIILGFYSSCVDKPYRFQFIYIPRGNNITDKWYDPSKISQRIDSRVINEKDCQYYIDFPNPTSYSNKNEYYGFHLPSNLSVVNPKVLANTATQHGETDQTISIWYRGDRYNYTTRYQYHPGLKKYVSLYKKNVGTAQEPNWENYYGYINTKYYSPALIQNLASNGSCENVTGWTGSRWNDGSALDGVVEPVHGRFSDSFVKSLNDLENGTFESFLSNYKSYLRINFPNSSSRIFNSGPVDNRTLVGNMEVGSRWAVKAVCYSASGALLSGNSFPFTIALKNCSYQGSSYNDIKDEDGLDYITFSTPTTKDGYQIFEVLTNTYTAEQFKKSSNIRVCLTPKDGCLATDYYLKSLEVFMAIENDSGSLIIPDEQAASLEGLESRTIKKTYYYMRQADDVDNSKTEDTIIPTQQSAIALAEYVPIFNDGAQKIRSVEVKESNYFNILQTLAETFGAWLKIQVDRDIYGGVTRKNILFKNYIGQDNYAGFKYGVNLKDIQRTYESKNIVTKLIVKDNSNELASNGFCTIARAAVNPTGENYIYNFSYFHNQGLLNARDYIESVYVTDDATGPDLGIGHGGEKYNLKGYFQRIKTLNNTLLKENETLNNIQKDLLQYKAELEVETAKRDAAASGIEQTEQDFEQVTGILPTQVDAQKLSGSNIALENTLAPSEDGKAGHVEYTKPAWCEKIDCSQNGRTFTFTAYVDKKRDEEGNIETDERGNSIYQSSATDRFFYLTIYPVLTVGSGNSARTITQEYTKRLLVEGGKLSGSVEFEIKPVDLERSDVKRLLSDYVIYTGQYANANARITGNQGLNELVQQHAANLAGQQQIVKTLQNHKKELNKLFYSKYYRFIQEGTWIDEKYVDDELYYADALSVAYNSCYPQVAYTINVVELSKLTGYEYYKSRIGDKTFVEDIEFFGGNGRQEVVVTEIVENLDRPADTSIKVQNFKNQFQDLFQKITATVQQAKYNTGSYEKAVALAEAKQERKYGFLSDALDSATAKLTAGGQQSVTWGNDGITVKSIESPSDAVRIVGGAILLSKQDKNGIQKWVTGVTSDGISASLVTAGTINTGEISIMNNDDIMFRWDGSGITAYHFDEYDGVVSSVSENKYVRFNKDGIYGIAGDTPASREEIPDKATFYLGWDGLKVTGNSGIEALIGKQGEYIIKVQDDNISDGDNRVFSISNAGDVFVKGTIQANGGTIAGWEIINTSEVSSIRTANHDIGEAESFHMYSKGHPYIEKDLFNSGGKKNWALTIGENFGIDKTGAIYAKAANVYGEIFAKGGTIGTWEIGEVNEKVEGKIGIFSKSGDVCTGLVSYGSRGNVSIWAGASYSYEKNGETKTFVGTPWEIYNELDAQGKDTNTWKEYVPFFVQGDGKVVCKDLVAKGGTIGGWTISGDELLAKNEDEDGKVVVKLTPSTGDDSVISIENSKNPLSAPSTLLVREASNNSSTYVYQIPQDIIIKEIRLISMTKGLKLNNIVYTYGAKTETITISKEEGLSGYRTDIKYTFANALETQIGGKLTFTYNKTAGTQTDIFLTGEFKDSLVFAVGANSIAKVNDLTVNNLGGKYISEVINDLQTRLTLLGFKGPYDIEYGDKIVGQVYQMGTLVYGVLHSGPYEVKTNTSLTIDAQIPGPYESIEVTWFVEYSDGVFNQHTHSVRLKKDNNGYLAMETTERRGDLGEYKARNWTYFCYSTENLINQHPTIDWV